MYRGQYDVILFFCSCPRIWQNLITAWQYDVQNLSTLSCWSLRFSDKLVFSQVLHSVANFLTWALQKYDTLAILAPVSWTIRCDLYFIWGCPFFILFIERYLKQSGAKYRNIWLWICYYSLCKTDRHKAIINDIWTAGELFLKELNSQYPCINGDPLFLFNTSIVLIVCERMKLSWETVVKVNLWFYTSFFGDAVLQKESVLSNVF